MQRSLLQQRFCLGLLATSCLAFLLTSIGCAGAGGFEYTERRDGREVKHLRLDIRGYGEAGPGAANNQAQRNAQEEQMRRDREKLDKILEELQRNREENERLRQELEEARQHQQDAGGPSSPNGEALQPLIDAIQIDIGNNDARYASLQLEREHTASSIAMREAWLKSKPPVLAEMVSNREHWIPSVVALKQATSYIDDGWTRAVVDVGTPRKGMLTPGKTAWMASMVLPDAYLNALVPPLPNGVTFDVVEYGQGSGLIEVQLLAWDAGATVYDLGMVLSGIMVPEKIEAAGMKLQLDRQSGSWDAVDSDGNVMAKNILAEIMPKE